jgi:DNA processing protein
MNLEVERLYWLGFSVFPGIGPVKFGRLLNYFGTARDAWEAFLPDLKKSGIGGSTANLLDKFRRGFSLEGYEERVREWGCWYLISEDEGYPRLLKQIRNAPFVLYGKGDVEVLREDRFVAVVGTRKITQYGMQVTQLVAKELVEAGCVVVSGLAVGVDSVAHATTVDGGGRTVAVLGSGVDVCSPAGNIGLYREIIERGGAIVSEFVMGKEPMKGAFPSRNRIIAGLSMGVVVTEGAEDSGALITAKDAFENKRQVFAIPGPITSVYSKGPNSLFGKGAIVVNNPKDILRELGFGAGGKGIKVQKVEVTSEERVILDLLQEPKHVDVLIKQTRIQAAKMGMLLSLMEMKGLVRNMGGGIFAGI